MASNYQTIGTQHLSVGATITSPTIPIGATLCFVEVEGDVRYSVANQDSSLTASLGGAVLSEGTKIDISGYDLLTLRFISTDSDTKNVHLTYLKE